MGDNATRPADVGAAIVGISELEHARRDVDDLIDPSHRLSTTTISTIQELIDSQILTLKTLPIKYGK